MFQPFQIEVCDRTGRVLVVAEITEASGRHFLGQFIRDDMPLDLRNLLQEYREIVADQMLSLLDEVQARVRAWDLRVIGIPGRKISAGLIDLQLELDGSFALEVE
jgi:hypothetical protein